MNQIEQVPTEDLKWGTKFCFCSQHLRVHSTGWCTVRAEEKIPIHANSIEDANKEYQRIKRLVEGK